MVSGGIHNALFFLFGTRYLGVPAYYIMLSHVGIYRFRKSDYLKKHIIVNVSNANLCHYIDQSDTGIFDKNSSKVFIKQISTNVNVGFDVTSITIRIVSYKTMNYQSSLTIKLVLIRTRFSLDNK